MGGKVEPTYTLNLQPIDSTDLSEKVYHLLRQKIFDGEFSPGAKLDLSFLEKALGVSRTPIKNALIRLSEQGLITIEPRRGTFVTPLTVREVAECWDVRVALEVLAAERGVMQATDGELEQARALLGRIVALRNSVREEYLERLTLDFQFHTQLLALARNHRLLDIYEGLHLDVIVARLYYRGGGRDPRRTDEDHQAILEAYEARDVEAAKRAIIVAAEHGKSLSLRQIEAFGGVI